MKYLPPFLLHNKPHLSIVEYLNLAPFFKVKSYLLRD